MNRVTLSQSSISQENLDGVMQIVVKYYSEIPKTPGISRPWLPLKDSQVVLDRKYFTLMGTRGGDSSLGKILGWPPKKEHS